MADPIIDGINAIALGHRTAGCLVQYLSPYGETLDVQDAEDAEALFGRIAEWMTELAANLCVLNAAVDVDDAVLDDIDRLAVVHQIHIDHSMFETCLSASGLAIPRIMAARMHGQPLMVAVSKMVSPGGKLYDPKNLIRMAKELIDIEPHDKFSLCDDLEFVIELQRDEAEQWTASHAKVETALLREKYIIEHLRGAKVTGKVKPQKPRKPPEHKASARLIKKVAELKANRTYPEIRDELHAKYEHLMHKTFHGDEKYPSDRAMQLWLAKPSAQTDERAT